MVLAAGQVVVFCSNPWSDRVGWKRLLPVVVSLLQLRLLSLFRGRERESL